MAKAIDRKKQNRLLWIIVAIILVITLVVAAVLFALNYVDSGVYPDSEMRAKNVILLIGDGMGEQHIEAGNIYRSNKLNMERFAVIGEVMTRSLTPGATDSAAAATAMATGVKTYNSRISYKDGKNLETVAELAKAAGKKVGVVVTKPVTDATPAAFLSHAKDRGDSESIARQLVDFNADILFGLTDDAMDALKAEIPTAERALCTTFDEINASGSEQIYGLLEDGAIQTAGSDTLSSLTSTALTKLSQNNENGFLLIVEGSKIDTASHDNDMEAMLAELNAFDAAVNTCRNWAQANGETVVMVTADHETGGLEIPKFDNTDANAAKQEAREALIDYESSDKWFTRTGHTSANVNYFIYATGSEIAQKSSDQNSSDKTEYLEIKYDELMDIPDEIDNTDIFRLVCQWLSI